MIAKVQFNFCQSSFQKAGRQTSIYRTKLARKKLSTIILKISYHNNRFDNIIKREILNLQLSTKTNSKRWLQALAVPLNTWNWIRSTGTMAKVKLVDQRLVDLVRLTEKDNAKLHRHSEKSSKALISKLATRTYSK